MELEKGENTIFEKKSLCESRLSVLNYIAIFMVIWAIQWALQTWATIELGIH